MGGTGTSGPRHSDKDDHRETNHTVCTLADHVRNPPSSARTTPQYRSNRTQASAPFPLIVSRPFTKISWTADQGTSPSSSTSPHSLPGSAHHPRFVFDTARETLLLRSQGSLVMVRALDAQDLFMISLEQKEVLCAVALCASCFT
ncbi:hypothetical protein ASG84_05710 [Rhodococcus sp. Leaf278]|nr:hypothetical protein ASG84_05710 [Rhodococcus sp. Leaf278]